MVALMSDPEPVQLKCPYRGGDLQQGWLSTLMQWLWEGSDGRLAGSHDDRRRTPRPLQSFVGTRGGVRRSLPDVSHGHRAIPNWFCWAGRGVLPGSFIPDIFMGKGMRVADLGLDSRIVEILKGQGIEELYPPQADPSLEKFDVMVATSERADSLLRHRTNWLQRLSVVVADEVHLINDADRGPTLEVTLAKLRQVNPKAQVLALSATIQNSNQLAEWLEAEHVTSDWRPGPLKPGVYFDGLVHFGEGAVQPVDVEEDDLSGLVTDIMATGGQALIFVNTRRSTEALARSLSRDVRQKLVEKDVDHLAKVSEALVRGQEEATSMGARLGRCIEGGVAFHHAGLTNDQRGRVEKEFRKGRLRCIVATPTLAMGVDLPARRVVIRDLNRFDVNYGLTPIPVLEVKQMCGRAGRPRYDPYGEAILFAKELDDVDELMDEYFRSPPEAIESKLGSEPALRMHVLANVATGHAASEEELCAILNRTFV